MSKSVTVLVLVIVSLLALLAYKQLPLCLQAIAERAIKLDISRKQAAWAAEKVVLDAHGIK